MFFVSKFFAYTQQNTLLYYAQNALSITESNLKLYENNSINRSIVSSGFNLLAVSTNVDIILASGSGEIIIKAGQENSLNADIIPKSIIDSTVSTGLYSKEGVAEGLYVASHYIVGIPVKNEAGIPIAVIITASPITQTSAFSTVILKMFLFSSLGVLLLSSLTIYFATKKIIDPLKAMSSISREFGRGNFSNRVKVRSRDEIGQLAESLNTMAHSLSQTDTINRNFIANVSHELRTPMTTIGGFVDGILDGTIPPDKQSHYLQIVSNEVKRLARLTRTMLNLSKIEAGELTLCPTSFNIMDVITSVIFSFESQINEKNINIAGLDVEKSFVIGDKDLIHQVIYNLIENAIKFTNIGGEISFFVYMENGKWKITVSNTGAGISDENLKFIFDRFYKTDKSRNLDTKGVGLGLSIVRLILGMHDTDIYATSIEGQSTDFTFYLEEGKSPKNKRINI